MTGIAAGRRGWCCGLPRDDAGRCVHRPGHPVEPRAALSAAELLDRFLADLNTWVMRADEPTGCLGVLCLPDLRRFAAHWLPSGEIPPPSDLIDRNDVQRTTLRAAMAALDQLEDAQCLTMRAAAAHLDRLTEREGP